MPAKINKRALVALEASRAAHERRLLDRAARAYHGAQYRAYVAEPATILRWIVEELRTGRTDAAVCRQGYALLRAELEGDAAYMEIERFLLHRYRPDDLHTAIIDTLAALELNTPIGDLLRALDDDDLTDNPTAAAALEALGVKRGILQEPTQ